MKLRLRGRGSGYKEGLRREESSETLHLCVSSKQQENFQLACGQVEALLSNLLQKYNEQVGDRRSKIPLAEFYKKVQSRFMPVPLNQPIFDFQKRQTNI